VHADADKLTIGLSQVGSESDWRIASTESVKAAFSSNEGYNLIFDDAQQKQENQLKAIREFIDQGVDYIILDPIVETGWDSVLSEAKEAGIPGSTVRIMFKRNTEPSIATLECICKGMGMTLPQFFDVDNKMGLSDEQRQLTQQWSKLNDHNKRLVSELVDALNDKA
jgi:hypothetical protein